MALIGLSRLINRRLHAYDVAPVLLALHDADRIGANREAGMGVLESVADENIIDIELAFSDFALGKIALDKNFHSSNNNISCKNECKNKIASS